MFENELSELRRLNEEVKGTVNYSKYYMECTRKGSSQNWIFIGFGIPASYEKVTQIKRYKENIYLMTNNFKRYLVTDEVKKILKIV